MSHVPLAGSPNIGCTDVLMEISSLAFFPARSAGTSHSNDEIMDDRDAKSLMSVLENEVIPLYYNRDANGLPNLWIERMMNSLSTMAWRFSAQRMVADYVRCSYLPASGGVTCDMNFRQ